MKVLVYGTLKQGGRLYPHMQSINAEFKEEVELKDHAMFNLGWFPTIIESPGDSIKGEVYEIDENGLRILDGVEGYPLLYQRKQTEHGFVYYMKDQSIVYEKDKIESGNWEVDTDN